MAKKALVSMIELRGKDNSGYRVLEVVDAANIFEVHSSLQWKDCDNAVEMDKYWWDPATSEFKKLPEAVDALSTIGELALDVDGNPIEAYEWDWDNEVWTKIQIINN